jgi:hypothetical protein
MQASTSSNQLETPSASPAPSAVDHAGHPLRRLDTGIWLLAQLLRKGENVELGKKPSNRIEHGRYSGFNTDYSTTYYAEPAELAELVALRVLRFLRCSVSWFRDFVANTLRPLWRQCRHPAAKRSKQRMNGREERETERIEHREDDDERGRKETGTDRCQPDETRE